MNTEAASSQGMILEAFPYLRVRGASEAIEYYKRVFGATECFRLSEPRGRVGHAELRFGPMIVMVADEYPEYGIHAPSTSSEPGSALHLHVEDVDGLTQRAVDAGAQLVREPQDQFYGERSSRIRDPFGHEWLLGSSIEEVSHEEMQRRFTAMCEQAADTENS